MTWKALTTVVSALAPTIGVAAHGPLTGSAVHAIADALELKLDESADLEHQKEQVSKAFIGSPRQLAVLKSAELDFGQQMHSLGFNNAEALAKLVNEDADTPRKNKDWTPRALALSVTAGFFSLLGYVAVAEVPESSRAMVNIMLGALGTALITIITYYFGSSATSDRRTDLLTRRMDG